MTADEQYALLRVEMAARDEGTARRFLDAARERIHGRRISRLDLLAESIAAEAVARKEAAAE